MVLRVLYIVVQGTCQVGPHRGSAFGGISSVRLYGCFLDAPLRTLTGKLSRTAAAATKAGPGPGAAARRQADPFGFDTKPVAGVGALPVVLGLAGAVALAAVGWMVVFRDITQTSLAWLVCSKKGALNKGPASQGCEGVVPQRAG